MAENVSIGGSTNLVPSSMIAIRITTTGDIQPRFPKTAEDVRVDADGNFAGQFDFSEQNAGDTFEVRFRADGGLTETVDGNVVGAQQTGEPTEETTESNTPGFGIAVALVALFAVRRD